MRTFGLKQWASLQKYARLRVVHAGHVGRFGNLRDRDAFDFHLEKAGSGLLRTVDRFIVESMAHWLAKDGRGRVSNDRR